MPRPATLELFSVETCRPSGEQIDIWAEDQPVANMFPLISESWELSRAVLDHENASDKEIIADEDVATFYDLGLEADEVEIEQLEGEERGTMGLAIAIQAAGGASLSSCAGHNGQASLTFGADTSVARKVHEILQPKPHEFTYTRFGQENHLCYFLSCNVRSPVTGAARLINWGEKLYAARDQFTSSPESD